MKNIRKKNSVSKVESVSRFYTSDEFCWQFKQKLSLTNVLSNFESLEMQSDLLFSKSKGKTFDLLHWLTQRVMDSCSIHRICSDPFRHSTEFLNTCRDLKRKLLARFHWDFRVFLFTETCSDYCCSIRPLDQWSIMRKKNVKNLFWKSTNDLEFSFLFFFLPVRL